MVNAMLALPWEGYVVDLCSEQAHGSLLIDLSAAPDAPASPRTLPFPLRASA